MAVQIAAAKKRKATNRITLRDVALRAGVSLTTVSLYLNGDISVCSRETGERIRSAVSDLNYVRIRDPLSADSSYQRAVSSRYTPPFRAIRECKEPLPRTIGLGVPAIYDALSQEEPLAPLAAQIWQGASQAAEQDDCRLLSYPAATRRAAGHEVFLDGSIAGLILASSYGDPRPARLCEMGLPVVVLARLMDIPEGCGAVCTQENDTLDLALSHLWDLGHRRIAHFAGPVSPTVRDLPVSAGSGSLGDPSDIAIRRLEYYTIWTRMRGFYDPALVFLENSWRGDQATEALRLWRSLPDPPTAVLCANDTLAMRILDAARQAGWRVPEELSVMGVDNSEMASQAGVALTSVAIPGERIGREAVGLLQRLLSGDAPSNCRITLPVTQVVVRATTMAPWTSR